MAGFFPRFVIYRYFPVSPGSPEGGMTLPGSELSRISFDGLHGDEAARQVRPAGTNSAADAVWSMQD